MKPIFVLRCKERQFLLAYLAVLTVCLAGDAQSYAGGATTGAREPAQKPSAPAWVLVRSGEQQYAQGHYAQAREALEAAVKFNSPPGAIIRARQSHLGLGFADVYRDWTTVETEHFRFHFSPALSGIDRKDFAEKRERAFDVISNFFHPALPKKIDFFAWRQSEDATRLGLPTLGFARSEFCLIHSRANQTLGHEMTHIITHHGEHPVATHALINEGVAVYFDQTRGNRMQRAQRSVPAEKVTLPVIRRLWQSRDVRSGSVPYAVAGAWVERLHQKGGDVKLHQLIHDQTFVAAQKIYGPELNLWIEEFEKELAKP